MSYSIVTGRDLESMRRAGALAAELLSQVGGWIKPGITTESINHRVDMWTQARGAISAPLNYRGFPRHCCISVNNEVCHGIPGPRVLEPGDLVNVDVTPIVGGWHGDTNATFYVGAPSSEARHVTEVARRCLQIGLEQVRRTAARHRRRHPGLRRGPGLQRRARLQRPRHRTHLPLRAHRAALPARGAG